MNLAAVLPKPIDRLLFAAWSRAQGLSHQQQERALEWLQNVPRHYLAKGDHGGLQQRALEDARQAGLRAGAVEDAIALSTFGPEVIAKAESGKGPALLPAFAEMLEAQDDPPETDEPGNEDEMENDRVFYQELLRSNREVYETVKMANGLTAQENYLALLEHEEQRQEPNAQPAVGKYSMKDVVVVPDSKPVFQIPDGMTEAPGFKSFRPAGQLEPIVIEEKRP